MIEKFTYAGPNPQIGKTKKDTRVARLVDLNKMVVGVNNKFETIDSTLTGTASSVLALEGSVQQIESTAPLYTEVTINTAEILDLPNNNAELLPVSGSNIYYKEVRLILEFNFSNAFTLIDDSLTIKWGNKIVAVFDSGFITQAGNKSLEFILSVPTGLDNDSATIIPTRPSINQGIALSQANQNVIGGGVGSSILAKIWYKTETFGSNL